jgi:hypothetical protein
MRYVARLIKWCSVHVPRSCKIKRHSIFAESKQIDSHDICLKYSMTKNRKKVLKRLTFKTTETEWFRSLLCDKWTSRAILLNEVVQRVNRKCARVYVCERVCMCVWESVYVCKMNEMCYRVSVVLTLWISLPIMKCTLSVCPWCIFRDYTCAINIFLLNTGLHGIV